MDLPTFRTIVDSGPADIASCGGDLEKLYAYVGLDDTGSWTTRRVSEALYERIRTSFVTGHQAVWRVCRSLQTDLIREHVLRGVPLDPYFEVLDHLRDAMRSDDNTVEIQGNWRTAISAAIDHVEISPWGAIDRERIYVREFTAAKAAKALETAGFGIELSPGRISLTNAGEAKLVRTIEDLIAKMGGLNVARRIFAAIAPTYDALQGRYHLVPQISSTGGGSPQVPWGYLLQLAAKHLQGVRPMDNSDARWQQLVRHATAYAAIIDVQLYAPMAFANFDAAGLLAFLRDLALYDTLFRMPQLRPSDVDRLARGMLDFVDVSTPTQGGWTLDQALSVIAYILDPIRDARGPVILRERDICRALTGIPKAVVHTILEEVLCHPNTGPNQFFSRATDAPTPQDQTLGITFSSRPLLKLGTNYVLIDRSVCAPACLEALFAVLRLERRSLDDDIGAALERFVVHEFSAHGVLTTGGDYDYNREHGECDIVVEAPDTLLFFELKKKALTRRARAGMNANLLLDLAGSLLQAHAQAGWHEIRLRQAGSLNLDRAGATKTLNLSGRGIEKVALSMLDYGSFQDRVVLMHFLEATMNATFSPHDTTLRKKFNEINDSLAEIGKQLALRYPRPAKIDRPFFECWFISVPQLLILLDGVHDATEFRAELWKCRHLTTGTSDLYYELAYSRRAQEANAPHTS